MTENLMKKTQNAGCKGSILKTIRAYDAIL
jgi:hypothetical protein